jgi:alpha-tubulin suppressor-like RCC1 family protein
MFQSLYLPGPTGGPIQIVASSVGTFSSTPFQMSRLKNVSAIAGGTDHALAVEADGSVWAWGGNTNGQLGDGTTNWSTTPVEV